MTQAYTQRFTEVHELVAVLPPQTLAIGLHTYGWFNAANHQRGVFILQVGAMAQGSSIDVQLWQATDATGANAKIVAGKAITQLSAAAGDGNDAVVIEVRTEELDVNGGFAYVSAVLTVLGGTVVTSALALAGASNYVPVSTATWTEVVD
jgi:hypothetical protein